jgi:sulfatase maturation enzyme AslB (radical SAM superfamily)
MHTNTKDPDFNLFNHEWLQQIRNSMLANEKLAGCNECYSREASSLDSHRNYFNTKYGQTDQPELRYLEFNLGNLCNLKCRMCGSWGSSKWISDEILLDMSPSKLARPNISLVMPYVNTIEKLRFIGGEPSLEQQAITDILDKILENCGSLSHLQVTLTTNCTILLESKLLEMLSQCSSVELQCSIDGVGNVNDYIRTGSDWSQITDNLNWYQNNLSEIFSLTILTSWSILNVNHAIDLLTFVKENLSRFNMSGHSVNDPLHLDICNIPDDFKFELLQRLDLWTIYDDIGWVRYNKQVLIYRLTADATVSCMHVINSIARLDTIRSENFALVDSETHAALVAACENTNQA